MRTLQYYCLILCRASPFIFSLSRTEGRWQLLSPWSSQRWDILLNDLAAICYCNLGSTPGWITYISVYFVTVIQWYGLQKCVKCFSCVWKEDDITYLSFVEYNHDQAPRWLHCYVWLGGEGFKPASCVWFACSLHTRISSLLPQSEDMRFECVIDW